MGELNLNAEKLQAACAAAGFSLKLTPDKYELVPNRRAPAPEQKPARVTHCDKCDTPLDCREHGYVHCPPQAQAEPVADQRLTLLAKLARHADDCTWSKELPTGAGYWGCSCGLSSIVLDGELLHPIPAAPAVPEGWKLVPIEPTEQMLYVGHHQIDFDRGDQNCAPLSDESQKGKSGCLSTIEQDMRRAWKAMLKASPEPQGGAQ